MMYLSHYNLLEKPFHITSDPKFLWLGEKHQESLATLKYGVLDTRGFLLLTGDVGTGKTTLINALLRDLDKSVVTATVVDPSLEKLEFFRFLARAFGIGDKFSKKVDFLTDFTGFLNRAYEDDRKVLLIIDEAQRLSAELLEEIRLLSNIEKEDRKLLNIFFVGQDEFKKTLMDGACRALRQRIAIIHQIEPLTAQETTQYIKYRLKVAGAQAEVFDRGAIRDIYAFSRGYPRLINIICDHALLTGFVREVRTINSAIIKECAKELAIPGGTKETLPAKEPPPLKHKWETKHLRRIILYAFLLLVIAFTGYLSMALGHKNCVGNAKRFYGQIFGSLENTDLSFLDEEAPVQGSKRLPTSGLIQKGAMPENTAFPAADHTKNQGPPPNGQQEPRYDAGVTGTEIARVDKAPSESETAQDVRSISRTPAHSQSEQRGGQASVSPRINGETLLFSHGKLTIPFYYDRSELPENSFSVLDRLAAFMAGQPNIEVLVTGHTDSVGDSVYNIALSELRANAVKDYLVGKGISPSRVKTVGMGVGSPARPNTTLAGRRANRRVEIELQAARRR